LSIKANGLSFEYRDLQHIFCFAQIRPFHMPLDYYAPADVFTKIADFPLFICSPLPVKYFFGCPNFDFNLLGVLLF
jgi:hypothetical protein